MELLHTKHSAANSLLIDLEYDINMGEFCIEKNGGELGTGGVSTCVVLVAHNSESRYGLLGHFSGLEDKTDTYSDIERFNEAVSSLPQLGDPKHTQIVLLGAKPYIEDGVDATQVDREYATQKTLEFARNYSMPNDSVVFDWSPLNTDVDVKLNCATGALIIEQERH